MVRILLLAPILLAVGLTGGCTGDRSSEAQSAERHAKVAATVMTQNRRLPYPTAWAVRSVIGRGEDDTIEALQADGTIYAGVVVLRITVDSGAIASGGPVTQCYRYRFTNMYGDAPPSKIDCPAGAVALALPDLPLPANLATPQSKQLLIATLAALTPVQVTDMGAVRTALERAFPPPGLVTVTLEPAAVAATVYEGDRCLSVARTGDAAPAITHSAGGPDCFGG